MVLTRRVITFLLFIGFSSVFAAEQSSTPYILTDFPVSLVLPDTAVWIKWTGASRIPLDPNMVPDSARIYFGTSPGGSIIENYTDSVTKRYIDTVIVEFDTSYISQNNIHFPGNTPQRGTKFRPSENNMGAGIYYLMAAWRTKIGLADTIFYSNEIKMIVEADTSVSLLSPANLAEIENLTPTFQWNNLPGVPYYHVIVSDEKINISNDTAGDFSIEGLSIIWEAITANTQITYGAPDPSGTINADPPPLSPGKEYSWVVLNNYGNHPAYSSTRFGLPSSFSIEGVPLKSPVNVWSYASDTLNSNVYDSITFKWTNLDSLANTYKVYLYVGSDFEGVDAQMVLWSREVTAGEFSGDTAFITLYAKSILANNYYTWKVIAIDDKGGGTSGNLSGFKYISPTGVLKVLTKENIEVGDTVLVKPVGLVEVEAEVLDGSLEAPLLFYTDDDGYLSRSRPVGTYRLTVIKDGFESQIKTVSLSDGDTVSTVFYLERPDATVYGKVSDGVGSSINLATVIGISDRGDTVITETDPSGNFILNCYEADWSIAAQKKGYISSLPRDTTVSFGQSVAFGAPMVLINNPYTLSGTVKNSDGSPLLGVNVKLFLDGGLIGQVPSTPQGGSFSFSVESGTYTLKATKVGFTSYSSSIEVLSSKQVIVTMTSGAALVTGVIQGRSWNSSYQQIYAPITNAAVLLVDTSVTPNDTFSANTGAVYGDFAISVTGGKTYEMFSSAGGYITDTTGHSVITIQGRTHTIIDTLYSMTTIKGTVRKSDTVSSVAANVIVTIVDTTTNTVIATANSDALGTFEMSGVPDGLHYRIQAGSEGFVADSIILVDTAGIALVDNMITVNDGLPKINSTNKVIGSVNITVIAGTKALQWVLPHGSVTITSASIKLQSPLQKTVAATGVVGGVGTGSYIMSIDADADSLLDCSYHIFAIPFGVDSVHSDTVPLPVVHYASDSIVLSNDSVTLSITVVDTVLDAGYIFFRDINAQTYNSIPYTSFTDIGNIRTYNFRIHPSKDGSYLVYYFRCIIGKNIYGYTQETYRSYVKPDANVLTRIAVTPFSDDTLIFPADAEVTFVFSGYYGSKFLPATQIVDDNVDWILANPAGCAIESEDKDVVIKTPVGGTGANVVTLQAIFYETAVYQLSESIDSTVEIYFKVSPYKLDSIHVERVDAGNEEFITTSALDKAEFVAVGIDENNNTVTITPSWGITPQGAGTIITGIFRPADDFIGRVRIEAVCGEKINEYFNKSNNKFGLSVRYLIRAVKDTATNKSGCQIALPANIVAPGIGAELSLEVPVIDNDLYYGSDLSSKDSVYINGELFTGRINVLGDIYDITDVKKAIKPDNISTDSIVLTIDIPREHQKDARTNANRFFIAQWQTDQLEWRPIENSTVADDGSSVNIRTAHFSRYALVNKPSRGKIVINVKPNPFSPYVVPQRDYGINASHGTCIEISGQSKDNFDVDFKIYNVVGDRVWSAVLKGALSGKTYRIWWDGKTLDHTKNLDNYVQDENIISYKVAGSRMCRNGRYFLVVKFKNNKEEKKYMKQIILFK